LGSVPESFVSGLYETSVELVPYAPHRTRAEYSERLLLLVTGRDTDIARRLIIVGTPPLTADADRYLAFLRRRFRVPLYYEQLTP